MAHHINLAPSMMCSTGPTTGCWEQGSMYTILFDWGVGRPQLVEETVVEKRVFCKYHAPWIERTLGSGYRFEKEKTNA